MARQSRWPVAPFRLSSGPEGPSRDAVAWYRQLARPSCGIYSIQRFLRFLLAFFDNERRCRSRLKAIPSRTNPSLSDRADGALPIMEWASLFIEDHGR